MYIPHDCKKKKKGRINIPQMRLHVSLNLKKKGKKEKKLYREFTNLTLAVASPDYSGEDGGWTAKPVPLRPLPVPTLYNGTTPETKGQRPKYSPLELIVYNIAAMLASVAAGYDVRLSNVTAVHPKLLPVK